MGSHSKQEVYQNFLDFYQKALTSGNLSPCTGEEQVRRGRHFLNSVASPGHRFQLLDFYRLAQDFIGSKDGQDSGEDGFRGLSKAFDLLELLAVNLYLWPWRKEIKSIKTFTGAFVYYIQPVFPPDVLQKILEKLGYVQKGASEYVMSRQVNREEIGQLGFEFFLARAECELMQEMLGQATHGRCEDIVHLRSRFPLRQSDCVKHMNTGSARHGRLVEGAILGNEGCSKSDPLSDKDPANPQFSDAPLPLTETNADGTFGLQPGACEDGKADAPNDPLSSSRRLPPDSIDLYNDYSDGVVRDDRFTQGLPDSLGPGEMERCSSLLVLDKALVENAQAESLGKLSPGQTGPLSLSLYSSSILIDNCLDSKHPNSILTANSPDVRHPRNKDSDALDQIGALKPEATKQEYLEDKRSGKGYQNKSSLKYGGFRSGSANSRKRDYVSTVEIELKNMELEKLPYPTAETSGSPLFHQMDHFGVSESQGPGLNPPEPPGARGLWPNQRTQQLSACQPPGVPECCLCSPVEIFAGQPLMDGPDFGGGSTQESGGSVVREPPQSFYIPPSSLESRPPAATCDVCRSPICPDCSSTLTAGHCQRLSKECLQIQELVIGSSSDSYLYVSKLAGKEMDGEGGSTRCNRCKEDAGL